jgi:hypothetical protein
MRTIARVALAIVIVATVAFALVWLLPPTTAVTPPEPQPLGRNASGTVRVVPKDARDEALGRAHIWRPPAIPIASAYLGNPPAPAALECTFKLTRPSGTTPKFNCVDESGKELRIKYGWGGEIPAEAAATRLLAALGFGADSVTLVERLRCFGCPKEPFTVMKLVAGTRTGKLYEEALDEQQYEDFNWVAMEQRFDAPAIEADDGTEGWAFFELKQVRADVGGAPRAHVDALRLLSVFLAHWDNKSDNQRIVCLSKRWADGRPCPAPFLLLQDVGATFGPRKVDLDDWEQAAIWKDRGSCTITMEDLPVKGATFEIVQIGDKGRVFLGSRLKQLTDAQLTDLFAGARFDRKRGPWGAEAPIAEWVRVFKARRDAIADGPPCPQG